MQATSETVGLIDQLVVAGATTAQSTSWVEATGFARFAALVSLGAAAGTVDVKLEQAKDVTGLDAKDIDEHATEQVASGDGANKSLVVDLNPGHIDLNNGFRFFRVTVTPDAATDISATIVGTDPHYVGGGASAQNDAIVLQVITQ